MFFKKQRKVPITLELSFYKPDGAFRNLKHSDVPPRSFYFSWKDKAKQVCCLPKTINIPVFKILSSTIFTRHAQLSHMYSTNIWGTMFFFHNSKKHQKSESSETECTEPEGLKKLLSLSYHTVTLLLLYVCLELVALLAVWLLFAAEFTLNDKKKSSASAS